MHFAHKFTVLCLGLCLFTIFNGCGSKGDTNQPAASINGTETSPAPSADASSNSLNTKPVQQRPHPVVIFDTSMGSITVQLDDEKADLTVKNFLGYVNEKFFDRTIFHQVFKGQSLLGGAYTGDMIEKTPHAAIFNEAENGLKNLRGTIAMVRQFDIIDSATSQFFFNVADNEVLDHKDKTSEGYGYCVFGKVVAGLDVLDRIANLPVEDLPPKFERKPVQTVMINSVRRIQ
jgi:cyclophilin family peptidyl-prolyl cis-trans isomerase